MVGRTTDWREELERFLKPFVARLSHKARRRMCPLYVSGLIGPGDRKSIQPMAKRLALGECDQLHHFIAAGVSGKFIVACGNAAEVFEPTEHALDEVAALVGAGVVRMRMFACRIGWDDRLDATLREPITQAPGVVGAVCNEAQRARRDRQQSTCAIQVMGIAWSELESEWPTVIVGQGVDFRRAAAP